MIPKLLHKIWLGGEMPQQEALWLETWRKHMPDWQIIIWNDHMIDGFGLQLRGEYAKATHLAQKADIARIEIVHRMGGI